LVETTTHKPTDQDFTAQITKLKSAGCDLVVLGTIVRDSIVPYATARKIGWTDVDFLGSAATYDLFVAAAQGGVTERLYAMGRTGPVHGCRGNRGRRRAARRRLAVPGRREGRPRGARDRPPE